MDKDMLKIQFDMLNSNIIKLLEAKTKAEISYMKAAVEGSLDMFKYFLFND